MPRRSPSGSAVISCMSLNDSLYGHTPWEHWCNRSVGTLHTLMLFHTFLLLFRLSVGRMRRGELQKLRCHYDNALQGIYCCVMLIARFLEGRSSRLLSQACIICCESVNNTYSVPMQSHSRAYSSAQLRNAGGHCGSQPVLPIPCRGGVASTSNRYIPDRCMSVMAHVTVSGPRVKMQGTTVSGVCWDNWSPCATALAT